MESKPVWQECIFCRRKWKEINIEFDLCPDCLEALRKRPDDYNAVKLDMYLRYGDFRDKGLHEAVKMMWEEMRKL